MTPSDKPAARLRAVPSRQEAPGEPIPAEEDHQALQEAAEAVAAELEASEEPGPMGSRPFRPYVAEPYVYDQARRPCWACLHPLEAHQHHRRGLDCAICPCLDYVPNRLQLLYRALTMKVPR